MFAGRAVGDDGAQAGAGVHVGARLADERCDLGFGFDVGGGIGRDVGELAVLHVGRDGGGGGERSG